MRTRDRRFPDGRVGPAPLRLTLDTLKLLVAAIAIVYAGIVVVVWIVQERMLFYPQANTIPPRAPAGWRMEAVAFTARDGTRLAGALLLPPAGPAPLVIYFGGNAEEVTGAAHAARETYGERAVLLVNYRGYGQSAGKPTEAALASDAIELYDWGRGHAGIDPERIAVHGRSLGSGVAVQLAAARPVRCVILTTPFSSALDVAREVYPWLPVALLMRHPFDSARRAPSIHVPALFLTGEADTLIPKRHAERLAAVWGAPVEHLSFEGFGHNDIDLSPRYAEAIHAFLDRHL